MSRRYLSIALVLLAAIPGYAAPEDLRETFAGVQPEYSPVPIWWWSGDRVEREGVADQLARMAEGGIHNAIILNLAPSGPLAGSAADDPPFLSEAWWDLFGFALNEAKRNGVKLWFYDQLGFSGAGLQARIVRDHPEFRGVDLQRAFRDVQGPADVEIAVPLGAEPVAAFIAELDHEDKAKQGVKWIWDHGPLEGRYKRYFRRTFHLDALPDTAHINITCDNAYVLYLNGQEVGRESIAAKPGWGTAERYDVQSLLTPGDNVIAVAAENFVGIAGLALELILNGTSEAPQPILSDDQYRVHVSDDPGWLSADFDDSGWDPVEVLGSYPESTWGLIKGLETGLEDGLGTPIRGVRAVTEKISDGALRLAVPAGLHRVQLMYTVPGGFDYQNPEAGAALIDIVHGEMERRFGGELGTGIAGSFQDEFPALPRYSRRMPDAFRDRMGYDLIERLPALFDDVVDGFGEPDGPTTIQIRCAANDVAAGLCEEAFFAPLEAWHERHGMLCGYDQTVRNADPVAGERYYIDYFKTMRHYSAPGNDMDGNIKPHQSIADLYGKPRVWMEAFHSSGWGQTLEEIATLLHPWIVRGATLYDPHAIYYSTHGSYWEWAPPDTGWRQPYFRHNTALADYISRLCWVLSQGDHVVELGLLHPASTVHAYSGFGRTALDMQLADEAYWNAQEVLEEAYTDYIILDEDSVGRASVDSGVLSVGAVRLKAVVLPATTVLRGETVERLARFASEGGMLVIVGPGPKYAADRSISGGEFEARIAQLESSAVKLEDVSNLARAVADRVAPAAAEGVHALHRRIGDRDFFFVLSDDGAAAEAAARFSINQRKLWETKAGRGETLHITLNGDGVPEYWDATTGSVWDIGNYRRANGATEITVALDRSAAPLIALRPPTSDDPIEVESDCFVDEVKRDGNALAVHAWPWQSAASGAEHRVRVKYPDTVFEGTQPGGDAETVVLEPPFDFRLEPTCDNRDGSFAWPPSDGPIPVEVRSFRHREESGSDTAEWKEPDFDDSGWSQVLASFGPRAQWAGPIAVPDGMQFDSVPLSALDVGEFTPAVYSLKLGIDEDSVFSSALGGKGRIPEVFLDLGQAAANVVYLTRATVLFPNATSTLPATLRVGGRAHKRAFVNGNEVVFAGSSNARIVHGDIVLEPGPNEVVLLASCDVAGPLGLFYQFLPTGKLTVDPEWIWSDRPSPTGNTRFVAMLDAPGAIKAASMIVALGDIHQIRVNGSLIADQGNFDPYFTSRAERYDIASALHPGQNEIAITARDTGSATGLLLDGLLELEDGRRLPFVSDAGVRTVPDGVEGAPESQARVLAAPSQGYMGDPATLLIQPRPHPLPFAGWLLDQPGPPPPFDTLVYAIDTATPAPAWYRFLMPPGATKMYFNSPGTAVLYVNGVPVSLRQEGEEFTAELPDPAAASRVVALRIQSVPGFAQGAALTAPITFDVGPGRIPLGSWDELGLPHYAGGVIYATSLTLDHGPDDKAVLDLGHVRGSVDVTVNGTPCGTRIWHPYRFDVTKALRQGENRIEIRVFNTLGPHFDAGHPSKFVFDNHTKSGIFGPVTLTGTGAVTFRLTTTE